MINWKISDEDAALITKVVKRARTSEGYFFGRDQAALRRQATLEMDITACHANGCPLDFTELLGFPAYDFAHDMLGINRHIDRDTGHLLNCFVPRCAK